ncbi:ABC transporter ATP-binding protein [Falsirhodobacter algicola]|uniref:ATP-binding cassette domain-containing protein n=1 Tax=Falsirhodobacter algicola TaxID=2692330 RepID=A0A8J8MVZ7_9RHOB|nr:ABC transporter ATP-binding protein [Falsirhodobacter algicola]QUS37298.1 ATP-binding cassette domain-containing protein [Falsirhodobacter algicola]
MSVLLQIDGVTRHHPGAPAPALRDVSLHLAPGEVLGIVGESGSGKSTLARVAAGLHRPEAGQVRLEGQDIHASPAALRAARRAVQMVFQDPLGSLDPRWRVGRIVAEPLHLDPAALRGAARRARIAAALEEVGLPADAATRFPHQFSGGQRQRIAIARALMPRPRLLIADEATSALDAAVQRQILRLILDLRAAQGLAVLFITHDIAVVDEVCDRVAVLHEGRIVEEGPVRRVLDSPAHPHTRRLLAAELRLDAAEGRARAKQRPAPPHSDGTAGCAPDGT